MNDPVERIQKLSLEKQNMIFRKLRAKMAEGASSSIPVREDRLSPVPASFTQRQLWFFDTLFPGNAAYNIPVELHLSGQLKISVLQQCIHEIVCRHEALRTFFREENGSPVQVIAPSLIVPLPLIDLQSIQPGTQAEAMQRQAREEAQRPFDLRRGPLLRTLLLRIQPQEHILLLNVHHIIADGWSLSIFFRELTALYTAFSRDQPSPLPELSVQYADYTLWQYQSLQGERLRALEEYWLRQLADMPLLPLPTDYPRNSALASPGAIEPLVLPEALTKKLAALCQQEGITLFSLLLAAFQTLLYRYTEQEDLSVGTFVANRPRSQLESLIGFFVNTLVIRTRLSGDLLFRDLLRRVHETALDAQAHQDLPFGKLIEKLRPLQSSYSTPLFQAAFLLQNYPMEPVQLADLRVSYREIETGLAKFDLVLQCEPRGSQLQLALEYNSLLFRQETARRMLTHLLQLLNGIIADPDMPLWRLPLLTEDELHLVLGKVPTAQAAGEEKITLKQAFEQQVARTPFATALSVENSKSSYRDLHLISNQLAHALKDGRVQSEQPVIVLLPQGWQAIIALLSVIKLEKTFVCLDPFSPKARLQHMLREINPSCIIADGKLLERHQAWLRSEQAFASRVCLWGRHPDLGWIVENLAASQQITLDRYVETDLPTNAQAEDLLYIAYTSGSTGEPKGIMQSHKNFAQFLAWVKKQFHISEQKRIAQWASLTFDAAYVEIFAALCSGATLCIPDDITRREPEALIQWVQEQAISLLQIVPSFFRYIIQKLEARPGEAWQRYFPDLEHILLAGEVLSVSDVRTWLKHCPESPQLWNLYGPTEAILGTYYPVKTVALNQRTIPIGRAIDGRQILILDQKQQPCPIGVIGEIYICSPYLSYGYFQRPEETQRFFLQNLLSSEYSAAVYCTGDMGRWLADGNIEYYGRRDQQIKIHGIRVELSGIEEYLSQHPLVAACAVVAHEYKDQDLRLIAYIVPHKKAKEVTRGSLEQSTPVLRSVEPSLVKELKTHLGQFLPDYMLPTGFFALATLPLTSTGKVNRLALLKPDFSLLEQERTIVAPRTSVESALTEVWKRVLGMNKVGIFDNFFEIGGHSLLAAQLLAWVHEVLHVRISLFQFIEAPTVARMAEYIDTRFSGTVELQAIHAESSEHSSATVPESSSNSQLPLLKPFILARGVNSRRPFFCVHPASGLITSYFTLASHLPKDLPFYALQDPWLSTNEEPSSIEDMATCYRQALQITQSKGPYVLGGYSFGGVVAFEMAQQLREIGEDVAALILIDAGSPRHLGAISGDDAAIVTVIIMEFLHEINTAEEPGKLYSALKPLSFQEKMQFALDYIHLTTYSATHLEEEWIAQRTRLYRLRAYLAKKYQPSVYEGPLTLFRAKEGSETWQIPDATDLEDDEWSQLSLHPAEIHSIPGNHNTIMLEPHVRTLAQYLSNCLARQGL